MGDLYLIHYGRSKKDGAPGVGTGNWKRTGSASRQEMSKADSDGKTLPPQLRPRAKARFKGANVFTDAIDNIKRFYRARKSTNKNDKKLREVPDNSKEEKNTYLEEQSEKKESDTSKKLNDGDTINLGGKDFIVSDRMQSYGDFSLINTTRDKESGNSYTEEICFGRNDVTENEAKSAYEKLKIADSADTKNKIEKEIWDDWSSVRYWAVNEDTDEPLYNDAKSLMKDLRKIYTRYDADGYDSNTICYEVDEKRSDDWLGGHSIAIEFSDPAGSNWIKRIDIEG